jgi:hypothetical protein
MSFDHSLHVRGRTNTQNKYHVSAQATEIEVRLSNLMTYITDFMYKNVCRGLFERHKLIFSFLITTSIMRNYKDISFGEWNYLLRGGMSATHSKTPDATFITQVYVCAFVYLACVYMYVCTVKCS